MKFKILLMAIAIKIVSIEICPLTALSQVVPDSTLPTQVEQVGNEYKILGGGTAGNNLFHSFKEFSIPSGMRVLFDNANNIENIFSRVTGGSISNIDGILKANGMANFFLINPNGIIFGPNAQLDVGGSFLASTASSIKFADGTEFSSLSTSTPPVLTVSVPIGLQFGINPGSIVNRSVYAVPVLDKDGKQAIDEETGNPIFNTIGLQINPNNTLALVGGEIKLERGNLTAIGGRIELGSVADNSYVHLIPISQGWQLGYEGVAEFQNIQSNESIVDASGAGGTVQIQGRNITLTTGTLINIDTLGTESAGDLIINASESVNLLGNIGLSAFVFPNASGNGGNITINTINFTMRDGAAIGFATLGQGQGGQLTINAAKSVEITGAGPRDPSLLTSSTGGLANAGSIIINTERLVVTDGGGILAITGGLGNGGLISINAAQSIEVSGSTSLPLRGINKFSSIISATSGFEDLGIPGVEGATAGNLNINTGQLIVSDGGTISVGTFRGGAAGNLNINANSVFLNQGNILAQSTSGSGGNILINASDLLVLRNNSIISATAGTQQTGGNGGNIEINARFIIAVPNENSDISADAFTGTGGNVTINETGLFGLALRNQPTPLSDITASSEFGQSGNIIFNRPEVDPQTGIVTLPSEVVDAENVVVQSCGTSGTLAGGEFVITGRGGTSVAPYEIPELNTGLVDLGASNPTRLSRQSEVNKTTAMSGSPEQVRNSNQSIVEAQGWIRDAQGNLILTAEVPNVTPSSSGVNAATCQQLPKYSTGNK